MREPGFYWIRIKPSNAAVDQSVEVARWNCEGEALYRQWWDVLGSEDSWPDSAIEVLSERLTPPA